MLFAAGTAASMALVSIGWARLLVTRPVARRMIAMTPLFASMALVYGAFYGVTSLS